jgi:hypothetical protein
MDTADDIWGGDMWGQYIIIDMDEEEKQEKKCEKNNKYTKYTKYTNYKKSYNQKLKNVSRMDCIDEEWSNMEMGICDDERNYLIPHGKNETLMEVMYNICNITWIMCTTLINSPHEMKMD